MTTKKFEEFDADARAEERQAAGLKFGGKRYPRVRRTNKVQRATRRIGREQTRTLARLDEARKAPEIRRLRRLIAEAESGPEITKLEAELQQVRNSVDDDAVDELQDEFEGKLFEMLEVLLGPAEDGSRLTAEQLGELDIDDASALSRRLMGLPEEDEESDDEDEDEPDPT